MRQKLYFKIKNTESPNSGVSSTIHKIQYDNKTKILTVSFHSGNKYEYIDVPEQIYDEAEKAESIAKYLIANVYSNFESFRLA